MGFKISHFSQNKSHIFIETDHIIANLYQNLAKCHGAVFPLQTS